MIKKLLFFFTCLISSQLIVAQAPGADSGSATTLTLVQGGTLNTGLQSTSGLTNNYDGTTFCEGVAPFYGNGEDGVYVINVTIAGDHTFRFPNAGNNWKVLSLHSGTPLNTGTCLRAFATAAVNTGSITEPLAAGTYYIKIDAAPFNGVSYADFELEIDAPAAPPVNDFCDTATQLYSNVNCLYQTFTNEAATDSGVIDPGCANYAGGDMWFTYEVNSTGAFTIDMDTGTMTDSGLAIYSGTCGALSLIECDDDDSTNGLMSSITRTGLTPGDIIFIRVWEYANDNQGTFDICITTPVPAGTNGVRMDCPGEFPRELTSDIGITCGVVAGSTSLGTTHSGNLTAGTDLEAPRPESAANNTNCLFSGFTSNYTVAPFTVDTTGDYIFEMTSGGFDGMGYIVEAGFTPGVCGAGFIVRDDDSGAGLLPQLTATLTAGTNYLLITTVYAFSSTTVTGAYTWDISFPVTTPQPDWYDSAVGGTLLGSGEGFNPVGVAGSGLPDTSTPGIYSFWVECPTFPGTRVQADYIIGKVWNGTTNNNWNVASNWSEGTLPTSDQCVCINATANDPVINDNINAEGFALTIKTGASVTIASDADSDNFGGSLTLQDYVDVQGTGTFTIQNGASLIQVRDDSAFPYPTASNSGDITLNRNTDIRQTDYVYWSSPVQGFDVSNIYGAFTPTNRIYEWIPTIATPYTGPPPGFVPVVTGTWNSISSGAMSQGKGYIVQGPTNFTSTVATATTTFTGVPNNGVITQPLSSGSYTGGTFTYNPYGTDLLTVTDKDDNWNLVGNPYPSALSADAFLMDPSNSLIEGAVHIWTHNTEFGDNGDSFYDDFLISYSPSDYITYNLTGVTNPNPSFSGNIASGQGFFVLALNDNETGSVTFNNSMRSSAVSNTDFYRNAEPSADSNAIERHRIWLDLIANESGTSSSTLIGYIEGATQQKDRLYDAYAREVNTLSLYSKINEERMTIQGRTLPFNQNDQVIIGAVIPQTGQYTIAINNIDGLFLNDSQYIYLEDTFTNTIHNLKAAPYNFTVEEDAIDYEDRFILRYSNDALSINEADINSIRIIAPRGNYIKINSGSTSQIQTVVVYDLLGRALLNKTDLDTSEFTIRSHNLTSGTYIVNVTLNNGNSKTQKVILKQ